MVTTFDDAIRYHAMRDLPNEACGLVLRSIDGKSLVAHETRNTAHDPTQFFAIPPEEVLAAKKAGNLVGYYHSHPEGDHTASAPDIANANECGLPCYIYGCHTHTLAAYVPRGFRAPLVGRRFTPLVHDCISLVWDWYHDHRQIELPWFPRLAGDYAHGTAFDFRTLMAAVGATIVTQPRHGDVVVMTTGSSSRPNHLGVFLEDGMIIHQRERSLVEAYTGQWRQRTLFVVRVPDARPSSPTVQGEAPAHAEGHAND